MAFVKIMLGLFLLCLSIGACASILTFIIDVFRWHDREERVKITPSIAEIIEEIETESEVNNNGDDAGKYDTSALYASRSES